MKGTWLLRLKHLERAQPGGDWRTGKGLSSLLKDQEAWERDHPAPEPTDLELEARARAGDGMARMLIEAQRAVQEGGHHGA